LVDARRRHAILVRYEVRSRQIEESAARHRHGRSAAEVATAPQRQVELSRWAELNLTKRELEVLQLIADGHVNEEIARHLHLAPETVKSHLRNIFGRLQARSRAHAVAIALRHSLIS
jgi:DNA-binding CsgD family transcriptional regulator